MPVTSPPGRESLDRGINAADSAGCPFGELERRLERMWLRHCAIHRFRYLEGYQVGFKVGVGVGKKGGHLLGNAHSPCLHGIDCPVRQLPWAAIGQRDKGREKMGGLMRWHHLVWGQRVLGLEHLAGEAPHNWLGGDVQVT